MAGDWSGHWRTATITARFLDVSEGLAVAFPPAVQPIPGPSRVFCVSGTLQSGSTDIGLQSGSTDIGLQCNATSGFNGFRQKQQESNTTKITTKLTN